MYSVDIMHESEFLIIPAGVEERAAVSRGNIPEIIWKQRSSTLISLQTSCY